jgi:bacterial/archaeal transporter family protein
MDVHGRSPFKNRFFITLLVVSNTLGNLFLGLGMKAMPDFQAVAFLDYTRTFLSNAWIVSGIALLALWMLAQLSMFSWADLSYVLPMTASAYVFTAVLGKFFLFERISPERWSGIVLIAVGVILVSETPPWTHPQPPKEEQP